MEVIFKGEKHRQQRPRQRPRRAHLPWVSCPSVGSSAAIRRRRFRHLAVRQSVVDAEVVARRCVLIPERCCRRRDGQLGGIEGLPRERPPAPETRNRSAKLREAAEEEDPSATVSGASAAAAPFLGFLFPAFAPPPPSAAAIRHLAGRFAEERFQSSASSAALAQQRCARGW